MQSARSLTGVVTVTVVLWQAHRAADGATVRPPVRVNTLLLKAQDDLNQARW
jgi:hypothetical protein